jgi:hypothetical protein
MRKESYYLVRNIIKIQKVLADHCIPYTRNHSHVLNRKQEKELIKINLSLLNLFIKSTDPA